MKNTVRFYIKKPVKISAIIWDGTNIIDIKDFCGKNIIIDHDTFYIKTREGNMKASVGDYIIKGIEGEFYPCKPNIFFKSYDEVK